MQSGRVATLSRCAGAQGVSLPFLQKPVLSRLRCQPLHAAQQLGVTATPSVCLEGLRLEKKEHGDGDIEQDSSCSVSEESQISPPHQVDNVDHVVSNSSNNVISRGNKGNRRAWNKGIAVPEAVRSKVSNSMKERWKDPEYRDAVSSSLRGRQAWNKGKTMSEETKEKMRLAKLNHSVSKETRKKMSQARRGKSLEPKAAALVSEKLKGVPKSKEHKENIAAAMRKRHAAIRVLNAVELVYESSSSDSSSQDAAMPAMPRRQMNNAKKQASSQVLGEFKAELREYRALQDEISPWNEAFVDRHGRKPTMADVERTGIEWLVTRYKRYVLLRERLFTQTTLLRRKLDQVNAASENKINATTKGSASSQKTNANGPTINELSANASRLHAAAQYKFEKSLQSTKQPSSSHDQGKGADCPAQSMLPSSNSSSSPRVREALNAAFEYRKNKAFETKSAALAAAAAASSKPVKK